jgi:hypothetical protein
MATNNAWNSSQNTTTGSTNDPISWLLSGNKKSLYNAYGIKDGVNLQRELSKRISVGMWPRLAQEVSFGNSLEPLRQNAVSQMLTALNPANVQASIDAYGRKANSQAVESGRLANLMMRGNNSSSGAVEGAQLNALNNAQSSTNSYLANLLSPEGIQKSIGAYLSALTNGQQSSGVNQFLSLMSGTPASVSSGDGWSNLLGAVAGALPWTNLMGFKTAAGGK